MDIIYPHITINNNMIQILVFFTLLWTPYSRWTASQPTFARPWPFRPFPKRNDPVEDATKISKHQVFRNISAFSPSHMSLDGVDERFPLVENITSSFASMLQKFEMIEYLENKYISERDKLRIIQEQTDSEITCGNIWVHLEW